MTNEEMIARARAGDESIFEEFFTKNEPFTYHIARKFSNTGLDVEDLASIAKVGMLKAYHSFDLDKAIKFATYAARCMSNEILMFLRKNNKHIGLVSLDAALNIDFDGNELTLADVLEDTSALTPDSRVMSEALMKVTEGFLQTLSERDRGIFLSCVVEEKKQDHIASEFDISQSYISRLVKRLIKKFQKYARRVGFIDGQENMTAKQIELGDEAQEETNVKAWQCAECGSDNKPAGAGSNTTLCRSCRSEKMRQGKKEYEISCVECGEIFIARSKIAKYCTQCKENKQSGKVDDTQAKQVPVYVHSDVEGDGKVEYVQVPANETESVIYPLSKVAEQLRVSTSALRKWCMGLEKQGYVFKDNSGAGRFMNSQDIFMLRQIQKKMGKGTSIEEVVTDVLARYGKRKEDGETAFHRLMRGDTLYLSAQDARKICEALDVLGVCYDQENVTALKMLG
ncbi:RNA polymerase sigma factor (sigma-70 family) [Aneurinibacillus soli]|uniref:RNA polymerase sigma-E factor n=1 Tax=Aneurinibacillus soli TaxID=1500254 RepID=A0A0U4WI00_9BACL|nr:sigma-70 family RNA polymerase sigma factor [Aneurinibacillus soli]PYE64284.1 RNA polymerase sigma factor (sigma-70 family) [Aneurinibacillus soli]BAU28233.1 RNA polymerase sigma-E factor precursor [Aneurinibacillus soli]